VNDFLMAAASATADAQTEAEVPSSSEQTLLAGEGGPLDSIIPASTDIFGGKLTANPNRTKAPTRQEVNR
jgi:hypothetical protein